MEYSDHWILTGWHEEQWDFQNNEKTMENSDHWIMTAWHYCCAKCYAKGHYYIFHFQMRIRTQQANQI